MATVAIGEQNGSEVSVLDYDIWSVSSGNCSHR